MGKLKRILQTFFHAIAEVEAIEIILEKIEKAKECYIIFETEMPYRKAKKYINNENVKYIIFKSRREGYEIRTLIDSCEFKSEITQASDINIPRNLTGIDNLIYVDVHGKLCCTKTLESAIKLVRYNERKGQVLQIIILKIELGKKDLVLSGNQ